MAKAAALRSDVIIVTSDNPRSEDPEAILAEITAGFAGSRVDQAGPEVIIAAKGRPKNGGLYTTIEDRRAAIRLAVRAAGPEDTVVICGKGHENYQIVGRERLHLDDREEARAALEELAKEGADEV